MEFGEKSIHQNRRNFRLVISSIEFDIPTKFIRQRGQEMNSAFQKTIPMKQILITLPLKKRQIIHTISYMS